MRKSFFLLVSSGIFFLTFFSSAQHCHGMFSQHVNITPANEKKFDFEVSLKSDSNNSFLVSFPWKAGPQHCWLIVFRIFDTKKKGRNFRKMIWAKDFFTWERAFTTIIVKEIRRLKMNANGNIEIKLSENTIQRSFISIDYPYQIIDGGFYYTIDLPEYLKQITNGKQ